MRGLFVIFFSILILIQGCKTEPSGPWFGNGFHNGWADQNSVVIWTRLTSVPELNRSGPGFLEISAEEHRRLDKIADPDSIFKAQMSRVYSHDEMEGAGRGTPGEVRVA